VKGCLQQELEIIVSKDYSLMDDVLLKLKSRWYIPYMGDVKKLILDEFHKIPYYDHPSYEKMIENMKKAYYCMIIA